MRQLLNEYEAGSAVDAPARRRLRRTLFGSSMPALRYGLLGSVIVAAVALLAIVCFPFSTAMPLPNVQDVLAAAVANLPVGDDETVEVIREIVTPFTESDVHPSMTEVMNDGERYLQREVAEDGSVPYTSWTERNPDRLTMTVYQWNAFRSGTIDRNLQGDLERANLFPDESNIPDSEPYNRIGLWVSSPDRDLVGVGYVSNEDHAIGETGCQDCLRMPLPWDIVGDDKIVVTMTEEERNGLPAYRIDVEGGKTTPMPDPASLHRTAWIRKDLMQLIETEYQFVYENGTVESGRVNYEYLTIPKADLDFQFTLESWLSQVDPEAEKVVGCHVYWFKCGEAQEVTENHPVFYVPEGWLEEPALLPRRQDMFPMFPGG